jgi:anti-anti-sigma factor
VRVHFRERGHVLVVEIDSARMDVSNTRSLRKRLALRLSRSRCVVFDLSAVSLVDSSGVGTLVWAHRRQQVRGGALHLAGVAEPVRDVLRATGLLGRIQDFATAEEDAL